MLEVVKNSGHGWQMRIGLHAGPIVAGIIGSRKFAFDIWGDAVNVASRLESTSVPGRHPGLARRGGGARPPCSRSSRGARSNSRARAPCRRGSSPAVAEARGSKLPDVAVTLPTGRSHQAIYRRWRAQTFGQIVGQQAVVETLRNAVRLGRVSHGLLFVGPRGTGKTSMARIVAKAVNCLEPCAMASRTTHAEPCVAIREGRALDVVELDAASNNRVDDMRELLPRVYTAPSDLKRKVFIIDEVQRIKEGWDVLLKTLEEPPRGRPVHLLHD